MLSHWDALDPLAMAIVAIVAPTLLPSKMKSGKGVALYDPQRVIRLWVMIRGSNNLRRNRALSGANYRGMVHLGDQELNPDGSQ